MHKGSWAGRDSGEGRPSGAEEADCPTHTVKIFSQLQGKEFEVAVPEDRYILWEAEDQGLELPYACRMGCCTACAVKVTEVRGTSVSDTYSSPSLARGTEALRLWRGRVRP